MLHAKHNTKILTYLNPPLKLHNTTQHPKHSFFTKTLFFFVKSWPSSVTTGALSLSLSLSLFSRWRLRVLLCVPRSKLLLLAVIALSCDLPQCLQHAESPHWISSSCSCCCCCWWWSSSYSVACFYLVSLRWN